MTQGALYKINFGLLANRAWTLPRLPESHAAPPQPDVTHVNVRYRQPDAGVLYSPEAGIRKESLDDNGVGRWLDVYA